MKSQSSQLSLDEDIDETQKLLAVVTRPVVRDRLLQLLHGLQQTKLQLIHDVSQQITGAGGPVYSNGYAAGFSYASGLNADHAPLKEQHTPCEPHAIEHQGDGVLSPLDPVWAAPASTAYRPGGDASFGGTSWAARQRPPALLGSHSQLAMNESAIRDPAAGNMQALLNNSGSILPALRYGMNVQLMAGQPQIPPEAAFRILTTCSWEQNAYTVKIYVPLHGVKTDLLRAVFQPNTIDIKTMNLQGKNYIFSIKQTHWPINPDGCSVVASKTKKNILITIAKAHSNTQEEKHWRDLQR